MAKLLALGFSLPDIVQMATTNAARLLGRGGELGSIRIGAPADISILRHEERAWEARDSQAAKLTAREALVPVLAIRGETVHAPLPVDRP
jgi:dihydroorotase